jgi:hypothetical protein
MPRMREAGVLLVGTALSVELLKKFDRETNRQTDAPDGVRVLVQSAHGDFASVKIPQNALGEVAVPAPGKSIAYVVRYGAYARGQEGESFVSFVREITPGDLDLVVSLSGVAA